MPRDLALSVWCTDVGACPCVSLLLKGELALVIILHKTRAVECSQAVPYSCAASLLLLSQRCSRSETCDGNWQSLDLSQNR